MTTKAATPAASSKVDKALAEVAGATAWAVVAGIWPSTDFDAVVFILYSLSTGSDTLKVKDGQNHGLNIRVNTGVVQLYIHDVYHSHW
jgi:hypothetical protein